MSSRRYRYDRLDNSSYQIRLVRIISKTNRKRIHLALESASLSEVEGQYEAVSYMWGPESPERHLTVDGKTLRVRDNIWHCLRHLRDSGLAKSRLWIDTICIDQSNDLEKSQQVAMMGQIFKNAARVLIWLGSTSLQTYLHDKSTGELRYSIETIFPNNQDSWINFLGHIDTRSRSLENQIMSIVYNSFWRRLWIVQEVALSHNCCIVFGKALLGKEYIPPIYHAARENSKPGFHSWIARQQDPNIENLGTALLDHHPMLSVFRDSEKVQDAHTINRFGDLISVYSWQSCSDPRDCVFGLMGLVHSGPDFEIDYTLCKEEVAVRALQYLQEEAIRASNRRPYLDFSAATSLVRALAVTSSTYVTAKSALPFDRAKALERTRFRLHFKPMMSLAADDSIRKPDKKAYKNVYPANISGNLTKYIYELEPEDIFTVRTLHGSIKNFIKVRVFGSDEVSQDFSSQLKAKSDVILLCWFDFMPAIAIRQSSDDDRKVEIKYFLWPDMTRSLRETSLLLEKKLSKNLHDALRREINACGLNWNEVWQHGSCESVLEFSALEIISLCEMVAPKSPNVVQ